MDLDITFFAQLGLLIALIGVLQGTLFKPLLLVVEKRHQQIHGTRQEVVRLERLAAANQEGYEAGLREARRHAVARLEGLRSLGREQARAVVVEARKSQGEAQALARRAILADEQAAQEALQNEVSGLARQLVVKLLGREIAA